ncbi:type III secretion T3S chaperone [Estrella lausannensis]|uniref:Type III secretion T3S chaperone n=1 Tax=Estrella lausannensis TaxID=483423 RepID=A0A0H5DQC4_9BACT|nr:type III secretion T3S chaperone [Estrella lausannensis]CRX37749.1 Conserved hypothetical protein [Estrella lausannensis]
MMKMPAYPLLEVMNIKKRRVDDQERVVKEKKAKLDLETQKLKEREADRDKVLKHHNDKLEQLRHELDTGTTTEKIKMMKVYLKEVKEKLKIEEKKVKEQKDQVELAAKDLDVAEKELKKRRQDVDKLNVHRADWEKEIKLEMEMKELDQQDEMGNVIFLKRVRESNR